MPIRCITVVTFLMVGLAYSGVAFAQGKQKHDKHAVADVQMKKLHAMMPMFSLAAANLEKAVEKGDAAAVELEVEKMLGAIPELKKSKPHKNAKQHATFVKFADSLEFTLTSTRVMTAKGDFNGARKAFKMVEKTCTDCHAKFRD